eukprot:4304693-Prymnesium_polylepis.2
MAVWSHFRSRARAQNRANFDRLIAEATVRPLLGLLTSRVGSTRRYAARALCNLSRDPSAACELHRLDAITHIVKAQRALPSENATPSDLRSASSRSLVSPMQRMQRSSTMSDVVLP